MADQAKAAVVKEALAKYGLDTYSNTELVSLIQEEWGVDVTPEDVTAMKARLRTGSEKPRGTYGMPPDDV